MSCNVIGCADANKHQDWTKYRPTYFLETITVGKRFRERSWPAQLRFIQEGYTIMSMCVFMFNLPTTGLADT